MRSGGWWRGAAIGAVGAAIVAGVGVVRAGPPPGQFEVVAEGVRDTKTGLVWEAAAPYTQGTLVEASQRCQKIGVGWRLPSLKELLSIVDDARDAAPAIDATVFSGPMGLYWTSSSYVGASDPWTVDFGFGQSMHDHHDYEPQYSRCVKVK